MELHELVEGVSDEKSFLAFVDALRKDRESAAVAEKASLAGIVGPAQRGWENITIESFLEAAHAWAEDTEFGARHDLKEASPWKKFAVPVLRQNLRVAKTYNKPMQATCETHAPDGRR